MAAISSGRLPSPPRSQRASPETKTSSKRDRLIDRSRERDTLIVALRPEADQVAAAHQPVLSQDSYRHLGGLSTMSVRFFRFPGHRYATTDKMLRWYVKLQITAFAHIDASSKTSGIDSRADARYRCRVKCTILQFSLCLAPETSIRA